MGRVTVDLNGKGYVLGCEDGREAHLQTLAARIDEKLRLIAPDAGAAGEARLILMAALLIADALLTAEAGRAEAETKAGEAGRALDGLEAKLATALDAIADRLETMAPETSAGQPRLL